MSRVITFSRVFPSYHPRAGEPTYFVEKIYKSFHDGNDSFWIHIDNYLKEFRELPWNRFETKRDFFSSLDAKHHTIRIGHRWKEGDWFRPCVWNNDVNPKSGRIGPYHSKQFAFAPDIQIKKVWDVELDGDGSFWIISDKETGPSVLHRLAKNDGLTKGDLMAWFNKPFTGQIICWNENINY